MNNVIDRGSPGIHRTIEGENFARAFWEEVNNAVGDSVRYWGAYEKAMIGCQVDTARYHESLHRLMPGISFETAHAEALREQGLSPQDFEQLRRHDYDTFFQN